VNNLKVYNNIYKSTIINSKGATLALEKLNEGIKIMTTESEGPKESLLNPPIGIVLGGGGVYGDFQIGALKFLLKFLNIENVKPEIICGTSVGAVNAGALAAAIVTDQDTRNLEALWLEGVTTVEEIYASEKWFDELYPHLEKLIRGGIIARLDAIRDIVGHSMDALIGGELGILSKLGKAFRDPSVANLSFFSREPIQKKFRQQIDLEPVISSDVTLLLAAVNLENGELEYFCNRERKELDPNRVKNQIPCKSSNELTDAVFASAAVPGLFKPCYINGKNYVDGSAREIVPIKAAYECGARTIFVILCFPLKSQQPKYIFSHDEILDWRSRANLLDIASRTITILLDEMIDNDLEQHRHSRDCITIDPIFEVHEFTEFDPGLIKINLDYGYMRAFDIVEGHKQKVQNYKRWEQLTEEITKKRVEIWKKEQELIDERGKAKYFDYLDSDLFDHVKWLLYRADTTKLYSIRKLKKDLKRLIDERIKECTYISVPEDLTHMHKKWELHNWDRNNPTLEPIIVTPWDRLDLGQKEVPVILWDPLHLGKKRVVIPIDCGAKIIDAEKPP
jgi:predicted acylesterase/phospholipase RssA